MRLARPFVGEAELREIEKVLSSGYLTQGAKAEEFERLVAEYVGSRHAVATSSCTAALHLSLASVGLGPGDEVLVADFSFPATGNVVVHLGAKPVFVDIDLDTFTMNPQDLLRKISSVSKAILPVDAFGCPADMERIRAIADEASLAVIEDAACALGATCQGRQCGTLGAMGCFSFHPRKIITTGEGGMIVTDDEDLAERARMLRSHGGVRSGYWNRYEAAGYNYKMSDILAAIGVAQIKKLDELLESRRRLAAALKERLTNVPGLRLPADPPWGGHIYQSFVVLLDERLDRDRLLDDLRDSGIETTLGTYAMHEQPYYQRKFGYVPGQLPNSHAAFTRTVTLPLYHGMGDCELDAIASAMKNAIARQDG